MRGLRRNGGWQRGIRYRKETAHLHPKNPRHSAQSPQRNVEFARLELLEMARRYTDGMGGALLREAQRLAALANVVGQDLLHLRVVAIRHAPS